MNKSDIVTRDLVQDDVAFVMSTFLKGLLFGGSDYFRKIPRDVYFHYHHKVIERLLLSPTTTCKVAVLKDAPDVILGYIIYRTADNKSVIDFAFTKKDWRNIGILNMLLPPNVIAVSNLTRIGESIITKKLPKAVFNPYI